jgi:hypothetical protein
VNHHHRLRRQPNNSRQQLTRSGRRLPRDARRVAPQVFQAVERAFVAMEDVDDDFEIIEHDPLARRKTIDRSRAPAVVFAQSRFNFARDRFQLRLRAGRTNHEKIGEAGNSGEIENDDVFCLLVRSELGAGRG